MKPYEWMVEYTPQAVWVDQRGILVWLSFYAGVLGGGLYLVSLYFNNLIGMFISWLIILVLKGGFHIAHSRKPSKLWRIILRPQTSWISRGLILVILFIGFGIIQLGFSYWLPETVWEIAFKILSGIMAFGIITYIGFVMNYVNGIPFWNSALLPVLLMLWGILSGLALIMAIALSGSNINIAAAAAGSGVLLVAGAVFITVYLWSATYVGSAGKYSVKELIQGGIAPIFWIGVVLCGVIIPLAIFASSYFVGKIPSPSLTIVAITCVIVGGLALTYCLLKVGIYSPLIPASA